MTKSSRFAATTYKDSALRVFSHGAYASSFDCRTSTGKHRRPAAAGNLGFTCNLKQIYGVSRDVLCFKILLGPRGRCPGPGGPSDMRRGKPCAWHGRNESELREHTAAAGLRRRVD